ncbi:MAG TPA: TolC family protein [Syntrophorhabdaceae bacterium]|jgi:outer membrane protein TolC
MKCGTGASGAGRDGGGTLSKGKRGFILSWTGSVGIVLLLLVMLLAPLPLLSITLEEAVKRAFEVSFTIKQQKEIIKSSEFSYISTIDPYLPKIDIQSSYIRSLNGQTSAGQSVVSVSTLGNFSNVFAATNIYTFTGTISYRLFDGGERFARRRQAYSLMGREGELLKNVRVEVRYNVKSAFYTALGNKHVVNTRKEALATAEKVYGLTRGRYDAGVAKKSEVLQAEVRMTTARIDLLTSVKQYERSLEELKSFLLYDPKDQQDVEGPLGEPGYRADFQTLIERAVAIRPDVTAQMKEIERLQMVYKERTSAWFPRIDAQLQQARTDTQFFPDGRQDAFILNFSYALFDGVGRYYNMQGASSDIAAARFRLGEIKRNAGIEIVRAYKDYELSCDNVRLYNELVRQANSNYEQAFGEYRVGKGDILALLQAEREFASARENYILAVARANTTLTFLERVAYLEGD